ncbi:hypothetical protein ACHAWF_000781, partial [Thalassiosira exigua]
MPSIIDLATAGLRRSTRQRSKPERFGFASILTRVCAFGLVMTSLWAPNHDTARFPPDNLAFATVNGFQAANKCFDGTLNCLHHMALAVGKENNESYTFCEMLKQPDAHLFPEAMTKEIQDHEQRGHWEVVPRSDKPRHEKSIMAIWSFKRKRFPDGCLNKHKARLCAHGGMQTWGINYWETYAPTVNWISVRFLLVVAEIMNIETQAIDFVLAFPQTDLEVPVYMELPAGIELSGHGASSLQFLLKLRKNIYGLRNASYNWHQMLKKGLEDRGFV